jgi:hypothetical protein
MLQIVICREKEGWGASCVQCPDFIVLAPTLADIEAKLPQALADFFGGPVPFTVLNRKALERQRFS